MLKNRKVVQSHRQKRIFLHQIPGPGVEKEGKEGNHPVQEEGVREEIHQCLNWLRPLLQIKMCCL